MNLFIVKPTIIKAIYLLNIALSLSSCAYHQGMMTGNASLTNAEFAIVDFAIGSSESTKILGFGGLKSDALVLEAKRNLYQNNPLKKGQALANVTVDFKREYYLVFTKVKIIVSAEIVDFIDVKNNGEDVTSSLGHDYMVTLANQEPFQTYRNIDASSYALFKIGDKVFFSRSNNIIRGEIIGANGSSLKIKYFDNRNTLRTINVSNNNVFVQAQRDLPNGLDFNLHEKITASFLDEKRGYQVFRSVEGEIVGLGVESAIVEFTDKKNKLSLIESNYKYIKKE